MLNKGDIVLCSWGYDEAKRRPNEFLFEFHQYNQKGDCIVYPKGESNTAAQMTFRKDSVRLANERDKDERLHFRVSI